MSVRNGFLPLALSIAIALVSHLTVWAAEGQLADKPASVGQPTDLVAVLGEDRARIWGLTKRILVTADKQRMFVTESLGHVSIFDTDRLKRIAQFRPHSKRCLDIALLHADKRLITISIDGTARLWNVEAQDPRLLDTFEAFDGSSSLGWLSLSVARRTHRVALRSDKAITLLQIEEDKLRERTTLPSQDGAVPFNYALSPDGRWLVTCENQKAEVKDLIEHPNGMKYFYQDAVLVVWDLSQDMPRVASRLPRKIVEHLGFSADGKTLVATDPTFVPNRKTHTWSLADGRLAASGDLSACPSPFSSYAFNDRSTQMAFGSDKGTVEVFRQSDGRWLPKASIPSGSNASCAFIDSDGILAANAPELQRWDFVDGKYRKRPSPSGHTAAVMGILFDARTDSLLSAGNDAIREWSLKEMSARGTKSNELAFENVSDMWPWGERKGFLLRRNVKGTNVIEGIRRSGHKMLARFRLELGTDYRDSAWCAQMHPSKDILATGHWDRRIRLWDITKAKPKKIAEWSAHNGHVCALAFSPTGDQLASVGWDRKTSVWNVNDIDLETKPVARELGEHQDIVRSVAWSPDGRFLASGGEDGQILLWDMTERGAPHSLLQPEDGPAKKDTYDSKTVDTLQFSRGGTRLLSGDAKGRVTVWSVTKRTIEQQWRLSGWVWDARFSPDETMVGTANYDGTVYLLRIANQK